MLRGCWIAPIKARLHANWFWTDKEIDTAKKAISTKKEAKQTTKK